MPTSSELSDPPRSLGDIQHRSQRAALRPSESRAGERGRVRGRRRHLGARIARESLIGPYPPAGRRRPSLSAQAFPAARPSGPRAELPERLARSSTLALDLQRSRSAAAKYCRLIGCDMPIILSITGIARQDVPG